MAGQHKLNLYDLLGSQHDSRKLRLFAVACCRDVAHLLEDSRSLEALRVVERYADGLATEAELAAARGARMPNRRFSRRDAARDAASRAARPNAQFAALEAAGASERAA